MRPGKSPYIQGSLWRTRRNLVCLNETINYIPANKVVLFLEEHYLGFVEDVKVLYEGHICYLANVDVAHDFDLNPKIQHVKKRKKNKTI